MAFVSAPARIGRGSPMRVDAALLISTLVASSLTMACSSTTDRLTTPTSGAPSEAVGSSSSSAPPGGNRVPAPNQPPLPPASGTCNAANAQSAVGERGTNDLLERACVAASASSARVIRRQQPITTELLGSPLNLQLNEQDVVRAVSCG